MSFIDNNLFAFVAMVHFVSHTYYLCVHYVVSNIELHLLYPFLLCRLLIWVQFVLILENKILLAAFVFQKLIYTFFGGCL